MEQMANKNQVIVEADEVSPFAWRSLGAVAALLATQARADKPERDRLTEMSFEPLAWAAE